MRTLFFCILLSLTPMVDAFPARDAMILAAAGEISLDEAVRRVQSATGGRVVSASASKQGGRAGYRIRVVVEDGRVMTYFVDAESGAMKSAG
jgi:uncharacterized membrane protein YkoI